MFWEYGKGVETPRFKSSLPPPFSPSPVASLRPCTADDKPAVFHRWVDADSSLLRINTFVHPEEGAIISRHFRDTGIVPYGCSVEVVRAAFALVEYPDGSVEKVKPELIQFLDREED